VAAEVEQVSELEEGLVTGPIRGFCALQVRAPVSWDYVRRDEALAKPSELGSVHGPHRRLTGYHPAMELTILGASGAWPAPGGAANGFLVRTGGYHLVLDFGMAVLPNLQRYLPHEQIDAIFISHEHWDHCLDLYPLFLARFFHPDPLPPLPVFAPAGVFDRLAAMEDEEGVVEIRKSFEFREVEPGVDFEVGPFAVRTSLLPHWVPNLGVRLEAEDRVLAYTGDTGTSRDIETLAREADVLIAEASWLDGQDEGRDPYHLTARQAGIHAVGANVGRLVLAHFWPTNDREVSREQAAEVWEGPITLAEEGLALEVA
jgi:ribonuclease BN (tRNA processing enzyme)